MTTEIRQQVLVKVKPSQVAVVFLDCAGKVNLFTQAVMRELRATLEDVAGRADVRAIVVVSGKPDTFCSGADIQEIRKLHDRQSAFELSRGGQILFGRLEALTKPVLVGIHGVCLGGGLEFALACHWRIATSDPSTKLGLPEVKLGLIPGLGGTQRLPRLVGLRHAIDLIISAEPIDAERAREIGLVDEVVSPGDLLACLEQRALELAEAAVPQRQSLAPVSGDDRLLAMTERSVRIKTRGHYPAPAAALKAVRLGLEKGLDSGLEEEATMFADLAAGEISKNLIGLFLNTEFARQSALATLTRSTQPQVRDVGIVGGGKMGRAIAALTVAAGHNATIKVSGSSQMRQALEELKILAEQRLEPSPVLNVVLKSSELAHAHLLIEAVPENYEAKASALAEAAEQVGDSCVIATNTSSLSVTRLAESVARNERFLGMHFFHPVERMPLVEVITHPLTSKQALIEATSFAASLGKTPITVKDSPGFLVNRLLYSYMIEAARQAEEGVPLNWIEDAAVKFGMPVGPLTLLDEVGLDIAFTVARVLQSSFGDRLAPPPVLGRVQDLGLVGKSTGNGVYQWDKTGRKLGFERRLSSQIGLIVQDGALPDGKSVAIAERLILPMIDEAARCLEEGVVRKAREIDVAMVLGVGFPAFRGGLLRYADGLGMRRLREKLEEIYSIGKTTRAVAPSIIQMEAAGRRFYAMSAGDE